jgi:two-component system cell cycle sensor histidine kinase/response regulator CckA
MIVGDPMPFRGDTRDDTDARLPELPVSSVPRIARICALGLAFDELLEEVRREIGALSGAGECRLFLCSEEGAVEPLGRGTGKAHPERQVDPYRAGPALERLADRLRAEGMLRADDVSLLPAGYPLRELMEGSSVRSALVVPLKFGTRLQGFLALHVYGVAKTWPAEVLRALELVAALLSAALERRRTEERLRASEARYRFIAENSPDLITLHDPAGRILYASPASVHLLGVRPDLLSGAPVEGFVHPDDREKVVEDIRRVASGEKGAGALLHRVRRADGTFVEAESAATAVPGDADGGRRVLRVTRDVSERMRVESVVRENQRRATVGLLAGGVAHEFNNLLTGIQGAVEMLSLVVVENPQARMYLDVILRMGNRAVELTQQLLAYARQGKYAPAVIPVRAMVAETVSALRASLPAEVAISVEVEEGIPHVFADAPQMKQVLNGLCLNAAEAMPGGGTVSVRARRERDGPRVVLEVSDTGPGIDAETMARIFEPFFSTKSAGRGMGLAAIRGIVENHEGEIRAASRPGEGATFTVLLPPSVERRKSVRHVAHSAHPGTGQVLLADDEPDVRTVVRAMLESLGYSVLEAGDGREAVELFRQRHAEIDLVLLDLVMPRLSGEGAFAEMQRIAPGVRAILASGYDESGRIDEIIASGFGGFLQKPFRRKELGDKIGEVMLAAGESRGE